MEKVNFPKRFWSKNLKVFWNRSKLSAFLSKRTKYSRRIANLSILRGNHSSNVDIFRLSTNSSRFSPKVSGIFIQIPIALLFPSHYLALWESSQFNNRIPRNFLWIYRVPPDKLKNWIFKNNAWKNQKFL